MTKFNKAIELFHNHSTLNYHCNAIADMHHFRTKMEHNQPTVIELTNTSHARLIQENREKFTTILKCIMWCGCQNVALRGHRDDDTFLEQSFEGNPGIFKALLQFHIDSGDNVLKKHFKTAPNK